MFCDQLERRLIEQRPVLDRCASGEHRPLHALRTVRMHGATQSEAFGFAAGSVHLLLRHRRRAAVANALRRENLDDIRSFRGNRPHFFTDLLRRELVVVDRIDSGEHARKRQILSSSEIANRFVDRRAERLNSGHAAHECGECVFRGEHRVFVGRLATAVIV